MYFWIVNFKDGEIIVCEGDWGNMVFFVIFGIVVVEFEFFDLDIIKEIFGCEEIEGWGFWGLLV